MKEVVEKFLATLRKTELLPPGILLEYQRGLLEKLLRHARAHVPFYRDNGRLDPLFRRDDTIDWRRWGEIAPVTRADVQQHFAQLTSESLSAEHGGTWTASTSGSTGEPARVLHTDLSARVAWNAVLLRDFERNGIDPTKREVLLSPFEPVDFDISGARRNESWSAAFAQMGILGERFDLADTRPVSELIEAVAALQPDYLQTQPTTLELMLAHDRRQILSGLRLMAVITYGEHCSEDLQRDVEARLGCRIFQCYGSQECGLIAGTCPHCRQFHVHAEVALVEVVNEDGSPTPPLADGRVLVTPFYNYAMPLIRYDHGDFAQVGAPACPITLPALRTVLGKKRTPFIFPGGRVIRPTISPDAVINHLGARTFQVAQTALDRCEFRIVAGTLAPAEMRLDAMTALLRSVWWDGLQVDYRLVEALPRRSPRAKIQLFVREFPDPPDDSAVASG